MRHADPAKNSQIVQHLILIEHLTLEAFNRDYVSMPGHNEVFTHRIFFINRSVSLVTSM